MCSCLILLSQGVNETIILIYTPENKIDKHKKVYHCESTVNIFTLVILMHVFQPKNISGKMGSMKGVQSN